MHRGGEIWKTFAHVARTLFALAAVGLVLWSFARVGLRQWNHWRQSAEIKQELVVLHWSGEGGPEEDEIVDNSLRAFEAANPGVRVRRINPGDAGSFYTKLQTMLASGEPPDVFYVGAERVASFSDMGLLEPLDGFIESDNAGNVADRIKLDDFYPTTVSAFRFDGKTAGNGALYGIPKDFTTVGFYYNKDLFKKAGLQFPSNNWTWDEYIADARAIAKLKDANGESYIGSEFVTWPMMVRAYLRSEGVEVRGNNFDELRLQDPKVQAALERLRSWRQDETNTLTSGRSKLATGAAVFTTGRVGMAGPFGRWVVPEYRRIRDFDWDYAPLPRGSADGNVIATVSWSMAKQSKNKDTAWKLIRWLTSPDAQASGAKLGLAIPTNRAVAHSTAFLDSSKKPINNQGFLDPAPNALVVDWPANPRFEQLLGSTLDRALKVGDQTVTQSTDDFNRLWNAENTSPLALGQFTVFPWNIFGWSIS